MVMLAEQLAMLEDAAAMELRGQVVALQGLAIRVADLPVPVGSSVRVLTQGGSGPQLTGEVVGFNDHQTVVMPLGSTAGVSRGDVVVAGQFAQMVRVGDSLLGRVLDGLGRPIDRGGPVEDTVSRPLRPRPIDPLDRPLINQSLATGVRAIDAMLSIGRGQRIGVFAPPGVGKSTLLGTMVRHTAADVSVVALVGERGREVKDFIENHLGPNGMKRSVVVCSTGDEPALMRIRAALVATSIAEYFRDAGRDVLLIMDSVTRFCQAHRQVGLAADEPPATKGYPPSVFAALPVLLERSGRTSRGSITGLYAVLVEGDELTDPVADASRGILDGHIQLSRSLAHQGHWPAIDVVESISRVADQVTDNEQQMAVRLVLKLVSAYRQVEDLVNIGAYVAGSNADFDLAIASKGAIDKLLQQGRSEVSGVAQFERTRRQLLALAQQIQGIRGQLQKSGPAKALSIPGAAGAVVPSGSGGSGGRAVVAAIR